MKHLHPYATQCKLHRCKMLVTISLSVKGHMVSSEHMDTQKHTLMRMGDNTRKSSSLPYLQVMAAAATVRMTAS